jgi:tRNA (cytidine/uridine-2'-O-)-methyltransferase
MLTLALYEPEIPQNTGTLLRLGACLGIPLHIIEPCGFAMNHTQLKRAGMDYVEISNYECFSSWETYQKSLDDHRRLVLLTPHTPCVYTDFKFSPEDILLLGKESSGVPENVHEAIPHRIKIPMMPDRRSLNMAIAGAIVLGEALRQVKGFNL